MTPGTGSSELREYLIVLWRHKYLIAITVAVTLGAALFYTSRETRMYSSSATVLVAPISLPLQGQQSFPQINMASEQLIASSPQVGSLARQALADERVVSPGSVSVESSLDDQTLIFKATSPQPSVARLTAQDYAQAYLDHRRLQMQQDLQDGEDSINAVIASLKQQLAGAQHALARAESSGNTSQATVLQQRITSLSDQLSIQQTSLNQILLAESAPVGHVLFPAYQPTSPSSPNVSRNRLLGFLLGIAFGVGFAFLFERLDERVHVRQDVEESTGAPLIARVPTATMPEDGVLILDDPYAPASEAYRILRARVLYAASQLGARVIMVTSFHPGEGKTTTAANLATALAQAGKLTVLVSADVRRPSLVEFFGGEAPGLTDVLSGEVDLISALAPTAVENLSVLGTGKRVDNPSQLLGSEAMIDAITRLADHAEFVIIDAPPITGGSDALSMASLVHRVLLVADVRRSRRGTIREAVVELRSVGAEVLGIALTHVSAREHSSYSYVSYAPRHGDYDNGHEPSRNGVAGLLGRLGRRS